MSAMIDVSCPKCGRRFGWYGTMSNRPACPKCGHRPSQEELDRTAAQVQAAHERLRTHPRAADAEMRRQQRIDAGLTLRQAAKLLEVHPVELSDYESCRREPTEEVLAKMAEVYGCGDER